MLDLYLNGTRAGTVDVDDLGAYTLRYDDDWVASPHRYPLSVSLPLTSAEHSGTRVENVLRGYLPESEVVLRSWSRRYRISNPHDPLSVLEKVGEDVAGAAQFVPHGHSIATTEILIDLDEADVEELVADARVTGGSMPHVARIPRLSLAGMQPKFALHRREDGGWALPAGRAASTHIFKPGRPELEEIEPLETALMRAAHRCGVTTATAEVMTFGNESTYVTSRYDRLVTDQGVSRIHQEDFAQAMGISPGRKYEEDGGPSAVKYVKLLQAWSSNPEADVDSFVRLTAFNTAVGNADAHAKNYGLLIAPGDRIRLTPAYDIGSLAAYPGYDQRLAFAIGGQRHYKAVEQAHWRKFARRTGLDDERVLAQVHAVWEKVPDAVGDELTHVGVAPAVAERIRALFPGLRTRTQKMTPAAASRAEAASPPAGGTPPE